MVTRSAAPLLLAVFTQAVGALCCVLGHCVKGRRLCTFIAGVLFIVSGKLYKKIVYPTFIALKFCISTNEVGCVSLKVFDNLFRDPAYIITHLTSTVQF